MRLREAVDKYRPYYEQHYATQSRSQITEALDISASRHDAIVTCLIQDGSIRRKSQIKLNDEDRQEIGSAVWLHHHGKLPGGVEELDRLAAHFGLSDRHALRASVTWYVRRCGYATMGDYYAAPTPELVPQEVSNNPITRTAAHAWLVKPWLEVRA